MDGKEYIQESKIILYASNGSSLAIKLLSKLIKIKLLKSYKFYVLTSHEAVADILACEHLLHEIDKQLVICETDMRSKESIKGSLANISQKEGRIDALVCYFDERPPPKPTNKLTSNDIEDTFSKNVYPNMLILSEIISFMKRQQYGKIISLDPIASIEGLSYYSGYSAARFAMRGFLETAAVELVDEAISICLFVVAVEKKSEIYRALDRAASFHGQTSDINNNKTLEYIETDEKKLIKDCLMKEINATKLANVLCKIVTASNKLAVRKYLNKSCENKAKELYTDPNGNKTTGEVSKFFLCIESDADEIDLSTKSCWMRGK